MQAERRQLTVAALVRRAVVAMLDDESVGVVEDELPDRLSLGQAVKVTVRLSAGHAYLLASRARKADVSQGAYVASLIDGTPAAPKAPDHARAVAALLTASDRLAVMNADLNAFMREVGRVPSSELGQYGASIHSLREDVRQHLAASAKLIAELRAVRGRS
jgi:hypothetical protein